MSGPNVLPYVSKKRRKYSTVLRKFSENVNAELHSAKLTPVVRLGSVWYVDLQQSTKVKVAVRESTTRLREITCHTGSHSVTCHLTPLTFSPLPQPKLVLDLATPEGCKAEFT